MQTSDIQSYTSLLSSLRSKIATELGNDQGTLFQREIDQLEGQLQPHIDGMAYREAQKNEVAVIAILAESTFKRVQYLGRAGMPTLREFRDQEKKVRKNFSHSFESLGVISNRIRGLQMRIDEAIRKKKIRVSDNTPRQSLVSTKPLTEASGSYAKLSSYIGEIRSILSDLEGGFYYDKVKRRVTLQRLGNIEGEVSTSEEFFSLSEGSILIDEINHLIGLCRDKLSQKGPSFGGDNFDRAKIVTPPVTNEVNFQKMHEGFELDSYGLQVVDYLQALSNSIRDTVSDNKSTGDGRFRIYGVSPFILALKHSIQRGVINPRKFSWNQVIRSMDVKVTYAKIMITRLSSYQGEGDIAENFSKFMQAIDYCTQSARIDCKILKERMRSFFDSNTFPE